VTLTFPNGTRLTKGSLHAGSLTANFSSGRFVFTGLSSGNYELNLTGVNNTYLQPVTARVSPGLNPQNLTVYPVFTFHLTVVESLSFNGTQPGPIINVRNDSAIRLVIRNNTTQVFNVAVVANLYNTSADNALFNSLSSTISAGGSVNDTLIVTQVGTFYYQSMTGNQARQGEYGYFTVIP